MISQQLVNAAYASLMEFRYPRPGTDGSLRVAEEGRSLEYEEGIEPS